MLYRIAGIETTEEATWLIYWGVILGVAIMAWTVCLHQPRSSLRRSPGRRRLEVSVLVSQVVHLAPLLVRRRGRMWQSLPPPLISGLGDSGGMLRTMEEEDAAAATTAASGGNGNDGGVRGNCHWRTDANDGGGGCGSGNDGGERR
jgi:hypothetical protein